MPGTSTSRQITADAALGGKGREIGKRELMGALKEMCCLISEVELAEFGGTERRDLPNKKVMSLAHKQRKSSSKEICRGKFFNRATLKKSGRS
jgi:hypothetical protein